MTLYERAILSLRSRIAGYRDGAQRQLASCTKPESGQQYRDLIALYTDMLTYLDRYADAPELVPDWDDVRGVAPDATGDLSSEEFVRQLRDEWSS